MRASDLPALNEWMLAAIRGIEIRSRKGFASFIDEKLTNANCVKNAPKTKAGIGNMNRMKRLITKRKNTFVML